MATFKFPNFNVPFPYPNLPAQLQASVQGPVTGATYGRWNGVNNNAFGLFPDQWPSLFGSPVPQPMQFQPPWKTAQAPGASQGSPQAPGGAFPPIPAGAPPGSQWQPIMQVPPPPVTPGMQLPALNPGQSPFSATNNVAPPGATGSGVPPTAPNAGIPPAGASSPSSVPKVAQVPANAAGGLLMPSIPTVAGNNTQFSTNMMPTDGNEFSREMQAAMNDPNNAFGQVMMQMYGSQPQTMTPAQFNQVARTNPGQAYTMLAQGGQPYQNAIMQQNGWTQQQMNDFINNAFYNQGGATSRFG